MTIDAVVQLLRELGSFGLLAYLVVRTGPAIVREQRATRQAVEELTWQMGGARPQLRRKINVGRGPSQGPPL